MDLFDDTIDGQVAVAPGVTIPTGFGSCHNREMVAALAGIAEYVPFRHITTPVTGAYRWR